MPSNKVRTRFAPSPTGYMHVGNLRTALYTYLMAKHEDGTFILRIEDTDQGRYVEGAVDVIYNTLRETGLLWDEGPDIGGPVGPYVQSERMGMFKQYAEQLVAEGKAYYCFCTEERLEALHAEQRAHEPRRAHRKTDPAGNRLRARKRQEKPQHCTQRPSAVERKYRKRVEKPQQQADCQQNDAYAPVHGSGNEG